MVGVVARAIKIKSQKTGKKGKSNHRLRRKAMEKKLIP